MTENLRNGQPSIEAPKSINDSMILSVWMMQPGEEKIVAKRFVEELIKAKIS